MKLLVLGVRVWRIRRTRIKGHDRSEGTKENLSTVVLDDTGDESTVLDYGPKHASGT